MLAMNNNNNNNNNGNKNQNKSPIVVDEDEPAIDVEETPFESRTVTVRRDECFIDEFEIVDFLGRGRFGEVKRCRERSTGREFAAKFIATPKPKDRDDVVHEVNIMRKLRNCRRLVQLYDVFETKKEMCLVLEIIYGGELFDRAVSDDFLLTEKACVCFVRQICEGIAFMHSKSIVHLDMKPENILCLSRTGNRIKIIDFGLAREYEPAVETRVMYGTPEFMAPEVVQFDPIDFTTDMWSVGVICYVLLSGLSPFMGDTDAETMSNVSKGRFEFHSPEFDQISDDAKDMIAKLLQADKSKRLTADQCLRHNWLKKTASSTTSPSLKLSKEHLKRFVYRRKWQKVVHAIIALKRMGVDLKSLKSSVANRSDALSPAPCCLPCTDDVDSVPSSTSSCSSVLDGAPAAPPQRRKSTGSCRIADKSSVASAKNADSERHLPDTDRRSSIATGNGIAVDGVANEPVAAVDRADIEKPSTTLNDCACNGRCTELPSPVGRAPSTRPTGGLHRRLNAVVRDRIIFFSKKDNHHRQQQVQLQPQQHRQDQVAGHAHRKSKADLRS